MPVKILVLSYLFFSMLLSAGEWSQAFGPNGNGTVDGKTVSSFSGSENQNILWRTKMPSTGQGTPIISYGKVFVTSHERIEEDSETGSAIV